MQLPQNIHPVRFPKGLAKALIGERTLKNKYETNTTVRVVGFYAALKSTNTCGVIKDYTTQLHTLMQVCKVSRSTFYSRLTAAEKAGLLTVQGHTIRLNSWRTMCDMHDVTFTGYHTIQYNLNADEKLQYIITAIALAEHRAIIKTQIDKHITGNPDIRSAFDMYAKHFIGTATEFSPEALFIAQQLSYANGAPQAIYEALHSMNPDENITVKTIQRMHGMKSHRSATYLKRAMQKQGIVTVAKRNATECRYTETVAPQEPSQAVTSTIVNFLMVNHPEPCMSKVKARKDKNYHTWYVKPENKRLWHHPDKISISQNLLK